MRRHAFLARCLPLLLVVPACGPGDDPSSDGGADGGVDAAVDAIPDAPLPDASPPEAGSDAPVDAAGDALPDQSAEASPDAPPDAPPDALTPDAVVPDAADGSADAPPPDAPYPPACGDGYRDPSEECDDGLGVTSEPRACTETCQVVDRLAGSDSAVQQRWLASPGALAAGPAGHAVAVVEQLEHPNDLQPRVTVFLFDTVGRRAGTAHTAGVDFDVAPAMAALPNGDYALIVSELGVDAEGLGVALYRVPASGGDPVLASAVNESSAYGQHGPVAAWGASGLTVAWLDDSPSWNPQGSGRRVCTRTFDEDLASLGGESCFEESDGWPSDLALASGSSMAIGWRELHGYEDIIVVEGEGWQWQSGTLDTTAAFEPPALAWLDADSLLVVATEGDGIQRATVIESGVAATSFEALAPISALARYEPALGVTPGGIYLAWSEPEAPPDGGWSEELGETFLQKLLWTGSHLDATSHAPIPLPREAAHTTGDQRRPALVPALDPSQPAPGGALLAAWNDLTSDNYPDQSAHGDVAVELIPTPILREPVN